MKIVIVAHAMSDQSLYGGTGRVACMQARGLAELGHQVRVVTSDLIQKGQRCAKPTFLSLNGCDVQVECLRAFSLKKWPGTSGPMLTVGSHRALRSSIDWSDVVIAHEWATTLAQTARRFAHRRGRLVVAQPHGQIKAGRGWNGALHRAFNRVYRPKANDHFLVGSDAEASEVTTVLKGSGGYSIHRLSNPMPLPSLSAEDRRVVMRRASWKCPSDSRILLYAHRIVPNKGLDLLIEALSNLPTSDHLVVVGPHHTGHARLCEQIAQRRGLASRVHFVGPVLEVELDEVILASDVFVLPARRDIFPMTVLKALACGRPVVLTETCQIVQAVRPAVAVAEPTSADLARVLASLSDGPTLEGLKRAGPALIGRRFAPHRIAQELEAILETLRQAA